MKKNLILSAFLIGVFAVSLVSVGWFGDFFGRFTSTGNVVGRGGISTDKNVLSSGINLSRGSNYYFIWNGGNTSIEEVTGSLDGKVSYIREVSSITNGRKNRYWYGKGSSKNSIESFRNGERYLIYMREGAFWKTEYIKTNLSGSSGGSSGSNHSYGGPSGGNHSTSSGGSSGSNHSSSGSSGNRFPIKECSPLVFAESSINWTMNGNEACRRIGKHCLIAENKGMVYKTSSGEPSLASSVYVSCEQEFGRWIDEAGQMNRNNQSTGFIVDPEIHVICCLPN